MSEIILASASPRRRELLEMLGLEFEIDTADINEKIGITEPEKLVQELSYRKAAAVAAHHPDSIVIGADTVVALDGVIMGKPTDEKDALKMLKLLSGRTHQVFTGVTIIHSGVTTFAECTHVTMFENDEELLKAYIRTGEPMDKAGAYGIQGKGCVLVKKFWGDYFNVVGLPVARVYRELMSIGKAF